MHKLLKQAFTLIELLVVIAIIGILSGLIIVGMNGMTQKANIAKAQVFSNSLRNALMMNLVSEWKFDNITDYVESNGIKTIGTSGNNVSDSWGAFGYNHGTASGGPLLKEGNNCVSGKCIQFDGNNDYVDCGGGTSLDITGAITLAAWVKLNAYQSAGNWSVILSKFSTWVNANYYLMILSDGRVRHIFGDGTNYTGIISISTVPLNTWYYIVATRSGTLASNQKIYINGQEQSVTGQADRGYNINTNYLNINYPNSAGGLNGLIDDVRIYNAAMPTSQIKEQYYAGLNKLLAKGEITKKDYQNRIGELSTKL